mmetsp:Transcript_29841/g.70967  ORF Transcript_29841/g.70967 Transcript_29841/m.70967 type:complete len:308 (+) Transcript_29841:45-968(+)
MTYPPIPADIAAQPKFAVIGGSGVTVAGVERFSFSTALGEVVNISFLDDAKRVVFVNRHLCTHVDKDGKATYAPPHEVNYHAMILALKKLNVKAICAIGSTGTLRPDAVPVGSIIMPDDYAFVLPTAVTFWGKLPMATFEPAEGDEGRIHFAPASGTEQEWVAMRHWVQQTLTPVLKAQASKIAMCPAQTEATWPCFISTAVGNEVESAYVQTSGPRFETRSEIQQYKSLGHVVGMTCSSEWTLAQELKLPYVLTCAVDNSANGLSHHPGGPVQEYLDHKGAIAEVTAALVTTLASALSAGGPDGKW